MMRHFVFFALLISLSGCGQPEPTMAGGKWASALRDPDAKLRKKAAFTLGNIGPSDPVAVPALIEALHDRDAGVRREAILALLKCGRDAKQAVPALSELEQKDRDAQVRAFATQALEKLREL